MLSKVIFNKSVPRRNPIEMKVFLYLAIFLSLFYVSSAAVRVQKTILFSSFLFLFIAVLSVIYYFFIDIYQVTEAQMAETRVMLRNVCKPKSKLSDGKCNLFEVFLNNV